MNFILLRSMHFAYMLLCLKGLTWYEPSVESSKMDPLIKCQHAHGVKANVITRDWGSE